ncbi:bifunctional oligoribonuclease/PAP phosphatase NrnA [Candidatus Berkelbacteria bacterium]|nr:bifunctional oligoribonuclease/PAP phosphatase NrnA [Candidatus Berkelbacteria bacterium]
MTMLDTVIRTLQAADRVLVITHEQPDGDAIGTALALTHVLTALGKSVTPVCVDPVPIPFRFLPGIEQLRHDCLFGNFDLVVVVDCGDLRRTGFPDRLKSLSQLGKTIVNIDHHQRNDLHKVAELNYVDYAASSAAELVYPLLQGLGVTMTSPVATCLLTGLYSDTGGFKHSNTSPTVLRQAAALVAAGASLSTIKQHIACYRSVASLKLWGVALARARFHGPLKLVYSVITLEDFGACQATPDDLDGCVNLLNCTPEAKATLLVSEPLLGRIRASLRTEDDGVDVGALAQLFGGGGLRKAAGFSFPGHVRRRGAQWLVELGGTTVTLPAYQPARGILPIAPFLPIN